MDGYQALRERAAAKLDAAILAARKKYRDTCEKIDALRRELGDLEAPRGLRTKKTAMEAVREHMPRDRPFSISDAVEFVKDAEPELCFQRSAIKSALYSLASSQGIAARHKRRPGRILWADFNLVIEVKPYAAMPMSDVLADLLEGGPMTVPDLVMACQRLG